MKIKISIENIAALTAHIDSVNQRASAHTATAASIIRAAEEAESELAKFGLPKADRGGATAFFRSGDKVPAAYKYCRIVNHATLLRGSSGWFLVAFAKVEVFPTAKPTLSLALTVEQDAIVIAKTREQYVIAQPVQHQAVA